MVFSINAIDNEFAAATGDNVGVTENTSRFDNPPNGSKDLVITTKPGDSDPRLFELGDVYELTWGGSSGGGSIVNAVVVRSDGSPDGGIIVFEGLDQNGETAQIVWTPGIDLEAWYQENYNPSAEPEFYTTDQDTSYTHTYVCFVAGTRIDTDKGHRDAIDIRSGDRVCTADAGAVPVIWAGQRTCRGIGSAAPVRFAPGVLGNPRALMLSRQHRVLIRSPALELHTGWSEMLAPAAAFDNVPGVDIVQCPQVTYVHMLTAAHHLVFAEGAACETLHLGPATRTLFENDPQFSSAIAAAGLAASRQRTARPCLSMSDARRLLAIPGVLWPAPAADVRLAG